MMRKIIENMTFREKVVTGTATAIVALTHVPLIPLAVAGYFGYKHKDKILSARKIYKMTRREDKGKGFNLFNK